MRESNERVVVRPCARVLYLVSGVLLLACRWRVVASVCEITVMVCRLVIELLLVLIITIISVSTEYCLVESGRLGL